MENKSSHLNEHRIKAGDEELLELSLSTGSRSQPLSQPSSQLILGQPSAPPPQLFPQVKPLPPPPQALRMQPPANPSHQEAVGGQLNSHIRKTPSKILREGKSETIVAPYPWATTRRATVHSLEYLLANGTNHYFRPNAVQKM
ncbi:GLYCOFAMILY PROTEIN putative-RELATED [Salix koriyanagi]|uniref:GLYCOFAMILY PROTEIN putative-RELATED n=1 Tax=Salix koriyanagi TaxID=2511006 RepID=A0A9Q1AP01_9ROSI|nr:GLYCOFAMILY PROTEIN putative-RELATED [Salix koriyanagi]